MQLTKSNFIQVLSPHTEKMGENERNVFETAIELLGTLEENEEDEDLNESFVLLQNWLDSMPKTQNLFTSDAYNIIAQLVIDQRCNNSGLQMSELYAKLSELGLIRRDLTAIMRILRENKLIPTIKLKGKNVGRPPVS